MGAEFSDVALPFGETEEDARAGRNETGHWPFARATWTTVWGWAPQCCATVGLVARYAPWKLFSGRECSTRFSRGYSCQHCSGKFCDSSAPTDSPGRTAAFMARIIRCASVAARRSNMTRSACAEPGRWFCLPARWAGSRLSGHSCSPCFVGDLFPYPKKTARRSDFSE